MLIPVLADPKTNTYWIRGTCQCGRIVDVMMKNDGPPFSDSVLVCVTPGCGSKKTLNEILKIYEDSEK